MDATISASDAVTLAAPRTTPRRIRTPIVAATAADHPTVAHFLGETLDRDIAAEFKAALDDPFYDPRDRLLVRRGTRILAHAHITHRVMQFGARRLPMAGLHDLCVAPAAKGQGFGAYLLAATERAMVESGAVVGWLKTTVPHFFRRSGWALCGRHNQSLADARTLLARLLEMGVQSRRSRHLHIRPWRQWELGALARIYQQNLHGAHGPLERTDAYWQWLVGRETFDEIYVALEGPEQLDLREQSTRIIGYAVVRGSRVLEVLTSPDRPRAALELVARVSSDAIEHDRVAVTLCAPPEHPLHAVFLDAGGLHRHTDADRGAVAMARLLDPLAVLQRLEPEFQRRAENAGLPRPFDLGLLVEGRKFQIELGREGVRATANHLGRSYLSLNVADFTRLVLGQLDWDWAVRDRRLATSTALAQQAGRALFTTVPLYRPVWDEMT